MKVAVTGCVHGDVEKMYESILKVARDRNANVDLVLVTGDFQSVRKESDLDSMSVPPKYRKLGSFHKYFNGELTAPIPTVFIGGNHEASNHLLSLFNGGWVAPNIFFLGYSNVISFGGIRIAGVSGIYKYQHAHLGRFERVPFTQGDLRSVYHMREYDAFLLRQITRDVDIMMSHDWPSCITQYGNHQDLVKRKPFFKQEVKEKRLGNPLLNNVLHKMKPSHWFASHLHCRFDAKVEHGNGKSTKFLALDKCLPRRQFVDIVTVDKSNDGSGFRYDEEWIQILKRYQDLLSFKKETVEMPMNSEHFEFTSQWNNPIDIEYMECSRSFDDYSFQFDPQTIAFRKRFGLTEIDPKEI